MKKVMLIVALGVSCAPSAWAYNVHLFNGLECRHDVAQMPWTLRYNQFGTPDCQNEFAELTAALNSWSNVSNQWFRAVRGADTDKLNYGFDGVNLVVWFEPEYQAYGQPPWPWGSSYFVQTYWLQNMTTYYRVVEGDYCFNGYTVTYSDSGEAAKYDVQNLMAHQLGHELMLDDVYGGGTEEFTMYGYVYTGETKKRSLEYDDEDGIRYLYGYQGITLESFTAKAAGDGVNVTWRTSTEQNLAGYNLYRTADNGVAKAAYTKLNDALITGKSPYTYRDGDVGLGSYRYLLEAVDLSGTKEQYGPVRVELGGAKYAFALAAAYPNPAREAATIKFTLPAAGEAKLKVYDLSGRLVATPASGTMRAGTNEVAWDVTAVAPGVYVYRLEAAGNVASRRLVVAH